MGIFVLFCFFLNLNVMDQNGERMRLHDLMAKIIPKAIFLKKKNIHFRMPSFQIKCTLQFFCSKVLMMYAGYP